MNVFRQRGSISMVLRKLRFGGPSFEEVGLPDAVRKIADEHRGLVLVTGPTGSGKTTTLAAMIDYINKTKPVHIVTIEDPIEVLHKDEIASINQREVGNDTQDFLVALRAALRQDPDVILIGEMRDTETVRAAIAAAETGHLVLSTLHTVDATETVNRVIDFFPPYQQKQVRLALAGTLRGIVCQRLVPTVDGGRTPGLEILINNGRVAERIADPDKTHEIKDVIQDGGFYGMITFDQCLLQARAGRARSPSRTRSRRSRTSTTSSSRCSRRACRCRSRLQRRLRARPSVTPAAAPTSSPAVPAATRLAPPSGEARPATTVRVGVLGGEMPAPPAEAPTTIAPFMPGWSVHANG